jgi:hypothetical protein
MKSQTLHCKDTAAEKDISDRGIYETVLYPPFQNYNTNATICLSVL